MNLMGGARVTSGLGEVQGRCTLHACCKPSVIRIIVTMTVQQENRRTFKDSIHRCGSLHVDLLR